jgi:hypothetical protein
MKILFGAGKNIGSNIMLSRFLKKAINHDIKIAAYYRNHKYLHHIDWCLDAISVKRRWGRKNYFKENHGVKGPLIDHYYADLIINDLFEWEPDLVISDCESFTAHVANVLEVPLWYCSPLLQLIGIDRQDKEIPTTIIDKTKYYLESLPQADSYLVYSPLCDVSARPLLKDGFEWIRPYYEEPKELTTEEIDLSTIQKAIINNSLVTTGETSFVSDCLYSGKFSYITPNPFEFEQILNAQLFQWYKVGKNIGRSTNIEFIKRQVEQVSQSPILSIQKWRQLDECIRL